LLVCLFVCFFVCFFVCLLFRSFHLLSTHFVTQLREHLWDVVMVLDVSECVCVCVCA
jgi:hypothetical protein